MEVAATIRARRRPWVLLLIGAVVALALGLLITGKSTSSGVAWTRVVLDTPTSQVIEAAPFGADSLAWRSSLLAHLMASERIKQRLADQLGIAPEQLAVVDPGLRVPDAPASLPNAAAEVSAVSAAPYTLTASLNDKTLPIISIEAEAQDRERAARLAATAADVLKAQAPPPEEVADLTFAEAQSEATQLVPRALQGFVVDDAAPVRARTVETGPGPIRAVGLPVIVFGLWCACVALGKRLVGWARARIRVQPRMT